jgi:ATP-dependent phosphoenolpyruvate carboxykinase
MHLNCPILFVSFLRLDNIYAIANSTVLADMLIDLINQYKCTVRILNTGSKERYFSTLKKISIMM